eukprot:TRINITY_DN850_c1_g1_i1.p2 TRINITY_DN850_c1_g1~~TRINITY_DN850_c1_g1_i1.p2  ORF type:complete len:289 (+),score=-1.33 TRINITY_DN850_c1_g1_i1:114-980(+)
MKLRYLIARYVIMKTKKNRGRIVLVITGAICIAYGLITLYEPMYFSPKFGIVIDVSEVKYVISALCFSIGVASIWLYIRSPRKDASAVTTMICVQCQVPHLPDGKVYKVCPKCGGRLEPIEGFYERHPELKDVQKPKAAAPFRGGRFFLRPGQDQPGMVRGRWWQRFRPECAQGGMQRGANRYTTSAKEPHMPAENTSPPLLTDKDKKLYNKNPFTRWRWKAKPAHAQSALPVMAIRMCITRCPNGRIPTASVRWRWWRMKLQSRKQNPLRGFRGRIFQQILKGPLRW